MARNVRCHLRQESSRNTEEQDLQNSNYTRNDIWWECLALRKCEQNQMNTIEMKMLKWIQGKQEHITSDMLTSGKRHTQSQYILSP